MKCFLKVLYMSGYLPFLVIFIHEPIFMTIYE